MPHQAGGWGRALLTMLADLRKEYERKPLSNEGFRLLAARFVPAKSGVDYLGVLFQGCRIL